MLFFLFSLKVELAKLLHLISTLNLNKVAILLFCQNFATFNPEANIKKAVDEFLLNSLILWLNYYF